MARMFSSESNSLPVSYGRLLVALLICAAFFFGQSLNAHTPYAQWDAFRVRHLQILTARSDLVGDAIADKWVAVLAEHLPKSKAVVSRARNMVRMASLLKTDQAKVALLSYSDAEAMFKGAGSFSEYGPIPLQVLADDGAYLLVARPDLPEEHGFLVVSTLLKDGAEFNISVPEDGMFGMHAHSGALLAVVESGKLSH